MARAALNDLAADWTRVIYDHHGRIRHLEAEPPWRASFASEELVDLLATCDLPGIAKFLAGFNSDLVSDLAMFQKWLARYDQAWARRLRNDRPELIRVLISSSKDDGASNYATAALRLPALAAVLVRADRYHAGELGESYLAIKQAGGAMARSPAPSRRPRRERLGKGADAGLVAVRGSLQEQVASQYREHRSQTFFTLSLPTGYGKTFSGVLAGLEACRLGRCSRNLRCAVSFHPFAQRREIEAATGIEVFTHHHLTAAELADDESYEPLDTWQAPILATTLTQFFRALFPATAQQCLDPGP